ncbi:multidrug efflux SMR transporter [Leekyejoonella antrihumi]|uniref:Multidrug efflux SMR transporter n=1 Tax=Leekyejoonella antrihumi TaxID=1660198 RepID=A0A563E0C7_9MICO|nr:multidrug efflux SMR transporter [Leekyejoonella antrihumi]
MAPALLAVAIVVEVGATAVLPRAQGFTDLPWTFVVLVGYGLSIALLAVVVKHIPVAVTYAVWSGAGTALVAMIGALWLKEPLSVAQVACLALIILGVVGLNLAGTH